MGKCYSIDLTGEDHKHTDITQNTEEPQQKYRLYTVSYRLLGCLNIFYRIRTLALYFCSCSKYLVRMKVS